MFLSIPEPFFAQHFILNRPDWPDRSVFFFTDPGPGERVEWAQRFGKERWAALRYDPSIRKAVVDDEGSL